MCVVNVVVVECLQKGTKIYTDIKRLRLFSTIHSALLRIYGTEIQQTLLFLLFLPFALLIGGSYVITSVRKTETMAIRFLVFLEFGLEHAY